MKALYLGICLITICSFLSCSENDASREAKKKPNISELYSYLGNIPNGRCAKEAREKVDRLLFNDAHEILIICLNADDTEVHFEVVRTLLFELKWASKMILHNKSQSSEFKNVLIRELPYRGIVRIDNNTYGLFTPFSRQKIEEDFYFQYLAAFQQFDYLRLIVLELNEYLQAKSENSFNRVIALNWLKVLQPLAGNKVYEAYVGGMPSVDILVERLGDSAELLKIIEDGKIIID